MAYNPYAGGMMPPGYPQSMAPIPSQMIPQAMPSAGGMYQIRPVASIEEAKAVPTDFGGQLTIMPDQMHGMIYTKQLNISTGAADFLVYVRGQMPQQEAAPAVDLSAYVRRDEFEELTKKLNLLTQQLGGLNDA